MTSSPAAKLADRIGEVFGVTDWITVDQASIDAFADATGDRQWIHVDPTRAKAESPFGKTIAHGYYLLALVAPAVLNFIVAPAGIRTAVNYGLDRVRFINPVPVGSRVRVAVKLSAIEDTGGGRSLMTSESTIEVEGSEKPAAIARSLTLVLA